jgi:hypothetical protein
MGVAVGQRRNVGNKAEPAATTSAAESVASLESAHRELLAAYAAILAGGPDAKRHFFRDVFLESHINRQLLRASNGYLYRTFTLDSGTAPKQVSGRLSEMRDEIAAIRGTLSAASGLSRIGRLAVLIVPTLITFVITITLGSSPSDATTGIASVIPHIDPGLLIVAILPLAVALFLLALAFAQARLEFLVMRAGNNDAYALEAALFDALKIQKIREYPVDLALIIASALLIVLNVVLFNLSVGRDVALLVFGSVWALIGVGAAIVWVRRRKR